MNNTYVTGFKKAIPIMIGYTPLGIAFGAIAHAKGFNIFEIFLMSLTIFSGSGQFIAVGLLASGVNLVNILLTVFLVNSRYFLFAMSLTQKIVKLSWLQRLIAPQGITDETYLTTILHDDEVTAKLWFSISIFSHVAWITASVVGGLIGENLGPAKDLGLDFALHAMFIALTILVVKSRKDVLIGLIAAGTSLLLFIFGYQQIYIIVATFIAASFGMVIKNG